MNRYRDNTSDINHKTNIERKVFKMKKLAILLVAGSLAISGVTVGLGTARAADKEVSETQAIDNDMDFRELDEAFFAYPDPMLPKTKQIDALAKFLKKDTKLTKAEKEFLTNNYQKLLNTLEDIDKTAGEIGKITSKMTNNWEIEDKFDELANQNENLWNKIYENATDEDLEILDNIEFIKTSKVLTVAEKETLIAVEKEINALTEEYDKLYQEVEKATENLNKKLDLLYQDTENLMDKMQPLADKLGKEFKDNFGFCDMMPY